MIYIYIFTGIWLCSIIGAFIGILSGSLSYGNNCKFVIVIRNIVGNLIGGTVIGGCVGGIAGVIYGIAQTVFFNN